jgi:recombination associated protein RdgC
MWFKNLIVYRIKEDFTFPDPDLLEEKLQGQQFKPCGSLDIKSIGWVPPVPDGSMLSHTASDFTMICCQKEEKLLPASVINEEVAKKVAEIKKNDDRRVGKKERDELRSEAIQTLLPKAFSKKSKTYAFLSSKDRLLFVDCTSASKADELINCLRESLESFPVHPAIPHNDVGITTTGWISREQPPEKIRIGNECEFTDQLEPKNKISCKEQDLEAEEMLSLIEHGKEISKLKVIWNDAISCYIDKDLNMKRLRFSELLIEEAKSADAESQADLFDSDFAVMSLQLRALVNDLFSEFGGFYDPV